MPPGTSSTTTLSEGAFHSLRRDIISGHAAPGMSLAEAAVAERLGISRVPVREALFALEREGLVEFTRTGRAVVRELSPEDFEELFTLRQLLEPAAARLAAPRLRDDAAALDACIEQMRGARRIDDVTRLDLGFHELVVKASGNRRLLRLWRSLRSELELWLGRLQRAYQIETTALVKNTVRDNETLLATLRQGSPAAAERAMRSHINIWREWLPAGNFQTED